MQSVFLGVSLVVTLRSNGVKWILAVVPFVELRTNVETKQTMHKFHVSWPLADVRLCSKGADANAK